MAKLLLNVPFKTDQVAIEVEIDPAAPLPFGQHRYQLVVTDNSGNASAPAFIVVLVADRERPTAVLRGPDVVASGAPFKLSAEGSFDAGGGSISAYEFTYLGPVLR